MFIVNITAENDVIPATSAIRKMNVFTRPSVYFVVISMASNDHQEKTKQRGASIVFGGVAGYYPTIPDRRMLVLDSAATEELGSGGKMTNKTA
eukprot:scaffold5042_cov81-Cylindrotheca_fusiformis.AAC.2